MSVTWHSFDLLTGRRGAPVEVKANPSVSRFINEASEATVEVLIQRNGQQVPDWQASTRPGYTMLVALDDETDAPIWGGYVYRRVADAGSYVTCSLVTLENYLDRRYIVNNVEFVQADQVSDIAAGVLAASNGNGVQFVIDAPYSNWKRDRTYLIDEDKTFLSIFEELAGVENGIEFTVDLRWGDESHVTLDRVFKVRNRVGTAYLGAVGSNSDAPVCEFHLPGAVSAFTYVEDYSSENGANAVMAVSSGEGDDRPESKRHIALNTIQGYGGNMPMFERRFTPSTSITNLDTLDSHAARELQETWDGLIEFELELDAASGPQLDADWHLGDDVAVVVTCPRFPERVDSRGEVFPGFVATMRVIGWEYDFDAGKVKPRVVGINPVEVVTI